MRDERIKNFILYISATSSENTDYSGESVTGVFHSLCSHIVYLYNTNYTQTLN